jgi:hypothetical protein
MVVVVALILLTGVVLTMLFALSNVSEGKPILGKSKKEETPDITYEIEDGLKIVREQNGHEDSFAKYILYRKIDRKWRKRAWTYVSIMPNVNTALWYLLREEKNIYEPQQLNNIP